MVVYKSDKTYQEFDPQKVFNGICDAYSSIGEKCDENLINSIISNLFIYDKISSNEIRRQVEESLMSINKKVAKAYMEKHMDDKQLKDRNDFIKNYIKASNASTGSKYDSNANVSNKNIATLNAEIPKKENIRFNRYNTANKIANLYSKKLAKQYIDDLENHIIYKHDESSFGINSPYTYSAKEVVEVKYNDRHLLLPFDLLWDVLEEEEVLVNESDGAWQKYPTNLFVKDKGNVFTKVTVMTRKIRKRDLLRVKTSFGEDVVVTDNHPMIIDENDVNNTIEAINSEGHKQFKINDMLNFDGKTSIDMSLCPDVKEFTSEYCVDYLNQPFKRILSVDNELGYLVGFFVGDGKYNIGKNNGSIVFTQKNRETLVKLNNILFKKFGIIGNIRYKRDKYNCYNLTISNNALWWILNDIFKIQDKSENKTLPYNLLEYNENFAKGLLAGLIDADGTVNDCQLSIRLSSRAGILQATSLLRHFNYGVGNIVQNLPFSNNSSFSTNYTLWGVNCSVRKDSVIIENCDKLKKVRISDSSLKYKKYGETNIITVSKIEKEDSFLELNNYIYDITTDTRTFALNNVLVHNCVAIQSYPFLINGLKGLGGLSAAPKNIDSFCGMFVNLIFAVSSQFAGACLYKDQELIIAYDDFIDKYKIKDFVNSFELNNKFSNYQGDWECADISNKGFRVWESGRYVKINKVFRRKYDKDIYHIKSKNSSECFVSEDHRFKIMGVGEIIEKKAKDLCREDIAFVCDALYKNSENIDFNTKYDFAEKTSQIDSIETFVNDDEYVYEIETETHWYNCGGFITHNCAVSGFFVMFDHYARKEWGKDYYLNKDEVTRYKFIDGDKIGITIEKQIEQYFQQIVYSINQPAAARGFQSAFTNFAYFDKPYFEGMYGEFRFPDGDKPIWESISWLQKKFMKWFNQERTKCVLTFPVNLKSAA